MSNSSFPPPSYAPPSSSRMLAAGALAQRLGEKPGKRVIVAAVDETSRAKGVIAAALALQDSPDIEIHLVHAVVPTVAMRLLALDKARTRLTDERADLLAALVMSARGVTMDPVVPHLIEGDAADAIVGVAAELDADLLIVGGPRLGGGDRKHGLTVGEIARRATCPLYIVREKDHANAGVPIIAPACAACLEARRAVGNDYVFCARHSERHPQARLHHDGSDLQLGKSVFRP